MSKVLVTDTYLEDIADAIREKLGVQTTYRPGDMAAAIESISGGGYPEPTGTINITQNGTVNVKDYASANVNVQGGEPLPMVVSASSTFSSSPKQPYGIFGDVEGNFWGSGGTNSWLNINYMAPFNLKKVRLSNYYRISAQTYWHSSNITVRASNDGFATYTDLYTGTGLAQSETQFEIDLQNSDAYTEYRFIVSDATAYAGLGRVTLL